MTHTPGPWHVAEKARWQADVRFVRTAFDDSGVVGCCGDGDAHLVAAAPELLDSLRELLEICQWKCSPRDDVVLKSGRTNHEALVDAEMLISRIIGQLDGENHGT